MTAVVGLDRQSRSIAPDSPDSAGRPVPLLDTTLTCLLDSHPANPLRSRRFDSDYALNDSGALRLPTSNADKPRARLGC